MEKPIVAVTNNAPGLNTVIWEHTGWGVAYYEVRRKDPAHTWIYIAHVGQLLDLGLQPDTNYTYDVCAVDPSGDRSCSDEITVRTMSAEQAAARPPAPLLTRYEVTEGGRVKLWWRAPRSYELYHIRWRHLGGAERQERKDYEGADGYYELGNFQIGATIEVTFQGCNENPLGYTACGEWSPRYTIQVVPQVEAPPVQQVPLVPAIYSSAADGVLEWSRHDGAEEGLAQGTAGAWTGARDVGIGWDAFHDVFAAGNGIIYAIAEDGSLVWYQHVQFRDPQPEERPAPSDIGGIEFEEAQGQPWQRGGTLEVRVRKGHLDNARGPRTVGQGWRGFKHVFAGGEGILYTIDMNGVLRWYHHLGAATGDDTWRGPYVVGQGWGGFKHVFPGSKGIIYAVTADGTLRWFRHLGFHNGTATWAAHSDVALHWGGFTRVFSPGRGIIYAVTADGTLKWFDHIGYPEGTVGWKGPKDVATGWGSVKHAFATLPHAG